MSRDPEQLRPQADFAPAIRRARLDQVTIYEITESELEALERGSPDSLFLNFAVALLSMAISLSVTFATTEIKSIQILCVLTILCAIGYVLGLLFLLLWWRNYRSMGALATTIRKRLPPDEGRSLSP